MPTLTPKLLTTPPAQNGAKAAAGNGKADDAPEQSFGAVLARQLDPAQAAADTAATLKTGKKTLLSEAGKDDSSVAAQPATGGDPAANLIAMLQAPVELRSPAGTPAEAVPADGKASLLTARLTADNGKVELPAAATSVTSAGGEVQAQGTRPADQTAPVVQAADPLKTPENAAAIPTDLQATAPRAQDVAAFNAPALSAAPPAVSGTPATIATPMGSSVWAEDFAQQVTWMATGKQEQTAALHLNPPDLGPLQVVVKVSDSQASVLFTSPHGAVREAIESAMPKLREMMADNGITLGNTSVSDQAPRDRGTGNDQGSPRRDTWASGDSVVNSVRTGSVQSAVIRPRGMVDTFA